MEQSQELSTTAEGAEHLQLRVGNTIVHRRLDRYLHSRFSQLSRSTIQKLIKEGGVVVNNSPAKQSCKLNPGDIVDVILPPPEAKEIVPEDIPLDIIHEDEHIIVINKQIDLIVHPARGYKKGTLVNGLVHHAKQLSTGSEDFRPGIVHRLDRNTTGVLIVAKTDTAHWRLASQFEQRQTKKTYLAVVHGSPELTADCIDQPLGVHPRVREKYAIRTVGGKESITFYEVMELFQGYSLVKVSPKTGRTHQIRVHLSYIKHPIVADDRYGGKIVYPWQIENREPAVEEPLMARVALHAWQLEIKHPETEEMMTFEAPLPADMRNLLDKLRIHRKK